jgi:hypothetical protein
MTLKAIIDGRVVPVRTLEAAAEAMADARRRGQDFDLRVCPNWPRSAQQRPLNDAEVHELAQLAARILIEEGTA